MKIRLCAISLTCFFLCVASEGTPGNVPDIDRTKNEDPTNDEQLNDETNVEEIQQGNDTENLQIKATYYERGSFFFSSSGKFACFRNRLDSRKIKSDKCPENYQLAEPHNKEELQEMVAFLTVLANKKKINPKDEVRFGANRTTDGKTVFMTNYPFVLYEGFYADGEPNNRGGNEYCVGYKLSVNGANDYACSKDKSFICMKGKTRFSSDASMVVNLIFLNFSEARTSCPYGYMLGEFYTRIESDVAIEFLLESGVDIQYGIFIGLYIPREFRWKWISDALYIEQKHMWASGEPFDPTGDEFCGSYTLKIKKGIKNPRRGWNNVPCKLQLPSICTRGVYQYSPDRKWLLKSVLKDFNEAKKEAEIDYPFAALHDRSDYEGISDFLSNHARYDKSHSVMLGAIGHKGSPPIWLSGRPINESFYSVGHHPVPRQKGKKSICVAFTLHRKRNSTGLKTLPCDTKLPRLYRKGVRCPDGYEASGPICIRVFLFETTYHHARRICEKDFAVLSSIHSLKINNLITTIMDYKNATSLWIGMDKEDGDHVWIDGSEMDFTYWAKGEPRQSIGLCIIILRDGTWAARDCDSDLSFVCTRRSMCHETICPGLRKGIKQAVLRHNRYALQGERVEYDCKKDHLLTRGNLLRICEPDGSLTGSPPECSPKVECEKYWIPGPRNCYNLNYTAVNYFDAASFCEENGNFLASSRNTVEIKVMSDILRSDLRGSREDLFWTNVNDVKKAGLFVSGYDYPLEFTPWDEDEPDRTKDLGQHCVATTRSGRWRVVNCRMRLPFICERPGIGQGDKCNATEAISELDNAYAKTKLLLLEGTFLETECKESHVAVEGDRRRQCVRGGILTGCPLKCSKQVKCDKGWLPGYKDCYKPIVYTKKDKQVIIKTGTLYRARITCQSLNSFVVSVMSTYDAYLLSEIIRSTGISHENIFKFLWLDFVFNGHDYQSQSGRESDYRPFQTDTDTSSQQCRKLGHCVKMNMFGTFFYGNCNKKHFVVCQKPSTEGKETARCQPKNKDLKNAKYSSTKTLWEGETVKADCNDGFVAIRGDKLRQCLTTGILSGSPPDCVQAASCSPNWHNGENDCRKAIKEKMSQTDAHKYCEDKFNSSLAEIHDTFTWKLVIDVVRQHNFIQMWIDADDTGLEGMFMSKTKRQVVSGMWDEDEPSNIGDDGHHCVFIKENGALGSKSCEEKLSFICVKAP